MTAKKKQTLVDALTVEQERTRTSKRCKAQKALDELDETDLAAFDDWADNYSRGQSVTIKAMARAVGAQIGAAVSSSGLGQHIHKQCCCYGLA